MARFLSPEAAQAALDALLVKARCLDELRQHALDIREPDRIIRELDKRIRRTDRLIAKAVRNKLRKTT